jgi:amino acid transporter
MGQVKLSPDSGVFLLLFYGLGNILGAGIYVLVGKVAGISGYFTVFAFLLACVIALFTAFSYMELASRYPVSAGEAVYIQKGIGFKPLSIGFGLLIIAAGLFSAATISHGFAGYLNQFIRIDEKIAIIFLIVVLVGISIKGIKASVMAATILTLIEIFGLLMIIYYGFGEITDPSVSYIEFIPRFDYSEVSVIFFGAFLAFYAFIGFEDMVNIAEEVKEPTKTFPIAIVSALIISTVLYLLIVIVALQTLPLDELQKSSAPFADIYKKLTGHDPVVISIIGMFAVVNGALIQIIMGSRVLYGMAVKGWLHKSLADVSMITKTPIKATILAGVITIIFALLFDIVSLASFSSMLILVIFTLINVSLIRIKHTTPAPEGVIELPIWIPWCGIALNLLLIGMTLFAN